MTPKTLNEVQIPLVTQDEQVKDFFEKVPGDNIVQESPEEEPDPAVQRVDALYETEVDLPNLKWGLGGHSLDESELIVQMGDNSTLFISEDKMTFISSKNGLKPSSRMGIQLPIDEKPNIYRAQYQELIVDPNKTKNRGSVPRGAFANSAHNSTLTEYLSKHQNKKDVVLLSDSTQELRLVAQAIRQERGLTPEDSTPSGIQKLKLQWMIDLDTYQTNLELARTQKQNNLSFQQPKPPTNSRAKLLSAQALSVLNIVEKDSTRESPWKS